MRAIDLTYIEICLWFIVFAILFSLGQSTYEGMMTSQASEDYLEEIVQPTEGIPVQVEVCQNQELFDERYIATHNYQWFKSEKGFLHIYVEENGARTVRCDEWLLEDGWVEYPKNFGKGFFYNKTEGRWQADGINLTGINNEPKILEVCMNSICRDCMKGECAA